MGWAEPVLDSALFSALLSTPDQRQALECHPEAEQHPALLALTPHEEEASKEASLEEPEHQEQAAKAVEVWHCRWPEAVLGEGSPEYWAPAMIQLLALIPE